MINIDKVLNQIERATSAAIDDKKSDASLAPLAEQIITQIEAKGGARINGLMSKAREAYGLPPKGEKAAEPNT